MPKNISHRELVSKLRAFGFEGPRFGGRHPFMARGEFNFVFLILTMGILLSHCFLKFYDKQRLPQKIGIKVRLN